MEILGIGVNYAKTFTEIMTNFANKIEHGDYIANGILGGIIIALVITFLCRSIKNA